MYVCVCHIILSLIISNELNWKNRWPPKMSYMCRPISTTVVTFATQWCVKLISKSEHCVTVCECLYTWTLCYNGNHDTLTWNDTEEISILLINLLNSWLLFHEIRNVRVSEAKECPKKHTQKAITIWWVWNRCEWHNN